MADSEDVRPGGVSISRFHASSHLMDTRSSPSASALAALACAVVAACAQLPPAPAEAPAPEPPAEAPAPPPPPPPAATPAAPPPEPPADNVTVREQRGRVSRYAGAFAGKKTASGAIYEP